ncbi:MAG TPA: GspE/PulE family protein [Candidatus Saccharimonadales bacterium]|nr:GspE/PulE family protein [Candidatus Saccharimonadales bacterium]
MSALLATDQQEVEKSLVDNGLLTTDQLDQARKAAAADSEPLLSYLLKHEYLDDEQLTKVEAILAKLPYINLTQAQVNTKILQLLPKDVAERYMAVPLGEQGHKLVVAMLDANNVQAVDFLRNKVGRPLKVYLASEAGIRRVLDQYSTRLDTQMSTSLKQRLGTTEGTGEESTDKPAKKDTIQTIVQDSPISKALSEILEFAAHNRASDVHIEPLEHDLKVRCRIDGVLQEVMRMPKSTEAALVSRIKILSNLKIDEHRVPQDGQFTIQSEGKEIDLRVAISPVVWGEQVTIRLLDKTGTSLKLEDLGYSGRALRTIRQGLRQSNGMILTSGPTGSGKSTSLYALIQEIKNDSINIVTLEDPIEYKMDGVNQIQVNAEVGLTFATGLRSILRQDPDVIMIGEIRDKETAQLAVQAALTGHLVLATLHTNSAAGILPRLLDMGIEPFLIASTVKTVIGQRLVRRISDKGKQTYQSSAPETAAIMATLGNVLPKNQDQMAAVAADFGYKSLPLAGQTAYTLSKGTDGPDTPGGYKGRLGLYEVFEVTEAVQALIMQKATTTAIQNIARNEGMVTMRQDGYLKALAGSTTLNEVNRVAAEDVQ